MTDRPTLWHRLLPGANLASRWVASSVVLPKIKAIEASLADINDTELRRKSMALRYRVRSGERPGRVLPEAFALVREAAHRTLSMRHFDVQLIGGVALFHGCIAEMETGEGKTLTATLPLYLRALAGKGAHLATVNDYLARRDAAWMAPVYRLLGLTVGTVLEGMSPHERTEAYARDITYGTAKEFGFDFLKDRLTARANPGRALSCTTKSAANSSLMQREPHFVLVDEADSILIDEARTPLIISATPGEAEQRAVAMFQWSAGISDQFDETKHYKYDPHKRSVELSIVGREHARSLPRPKHLSSAGLFDVYRYVERAIKVEREMSRDQHYVIRDNEVVIVDEFTGRLGEGRKWSGGIHQAVEAKEGVEVTVEAGHAARITVQDYFLRYPFVAGMTGTAWSSRREFAKVYRLPVMRIPTNRPVKRIRLPLRVFVSADDKWATIVERVKKMHEQDRPVLIGTRSIDKSEHLSGLLSEAGIAHRVLNARRIAEEAEIVAEAGQPGRVTVATNMAGRGTDIQLGEGVADLGGLFVIGTELHDSARIDRQLAGRCGRQGDPGTFEQYVAMDDELLTTAHGPKRGRRLTTAGRKKGGWLFHAAQRKVGRRHYHQRRVLLYHERHRKKLQREMGLDPYLDTPE
jgi:preprotein translocase subunit SecA